MRKTDFSLQDKEGDKLCQEKYTEIMLIQINAH